MSDTDLDATNTNESFNDKFWNIMSLNSVKLVIKRGLV